MSICGIPANSRVIFISSRELYEEGGPRLTTEEAQLAPNNVDGIPCCEVYDIRMIELSSGRKDASLQAKPSLWLEEFDHKLTW